MGSSASKVDHLFLDCEWADIFASELVSMAIVSIDDRRYFYGELEILPDDPTPWVRAVVYPLLERGAFAISIELMSTRLRRFLGGFETPLIHYDCNSDRELCERLLATTSSAGEGSCAGRVRWHLMADVHQAVRA